MRSYESIVAEKFCHRWLRRADASPDYDLGGAIDRFFSLYVAFNVLYTFVGERAKFGSTNGHTTPPLATLRNGKKPNHRERDWATRVFPQMVGYSGVWRSINEGEAQQALALMPTLVAPAGPFQLYHGATNRTPNPHGDRRVVALLQSSSSEDRIDGALDFVYQARCNLFHGSKDLIDRQVEILRPCNQVLSRLIEAGLTWIAATG